MKELENYIHSYFGVSDEDITKVVSFFKPANLVKGEYFLKTGKICDKLSFIQSGIIRVFHDTETKEVTQWIGTKGYFITDLAGLIFNLPSPTNILALTDCELFTISKVDYNKLGESVPQWNQLEKLFLARCFMVLEERIRMHLSMSAEERYQWFFDHQRDLLNQVPLHYIASMLGMTPETLSRLRTKF